MRWILVMLAACGGGWRGPDTESQAVGTFIGGGSLFIPVDDCTYAGTATVFDDLQAKPGPRMIRGAGTITVTCPKITYAVDAVVPTSARIAGPTKVTVNSTSEWFSASLYAGDRQLGGDASIAWTLSSGCANIATFAPVHGANHVGGPGRARVLVTTGTGKCQLDVILTTGADELPPKAFQASTLVTIE